MDGNTRMQSFGGARRFAILVAALAILALGCTLPPVEQVVVVVTATPGMEVVLPPTRTPMPPEGESAPATDTLTADPATPSATASSTATFTDTSSATPTATASATATATITSSNTATSTSTPSITATSTPTSTATSTRTPTRTSTPSVTRTSTSGVPMAAADRGVDVNCRFGPGAEYAVASYFMKGQTSPVYGRSSFSTWVQIQDPRASSAKCWVDVDYVTVSVPLASLAVLPAPAGYVYSLTLALEEDEISPAVCAWPVLAQFSFVIKVSGPALVRYQITSSVTAGVVRERLFAASGKIEDSFSLHLNAAGPFWIKLEIMAPNSLYKLVSGSVICP